MSFWIQPDTKHCSKKMNVVLLLWRQFAENRKWLYECCCHDGDQRLEQSWMSVSALWWKTKRNYQKDLTEQMPLAAGGQKPTTSVVYLRTAVVYLTTSTECWSTVCTSFIHIEATNLCTTLCQANYFTQAKCEAGNISRSFKFNVTLMDTFGKFYIKDKILWTVMKYAFHIQTEWKTGVCEISR